MNERHIRSERADPSILDKAENSTSGAIRVEHIRNGASISEQLKLRGIIRLEKSGVKSSREKRGISERSKNITER